MFIGIAVTPLAQAIAGAYSPPSSDPKTFSVTLSGITGATPSSVQSIVTILPAYTVTNVVDALARVMAGQIIGPVGGITTSATLVRSSGVAPLTVIVDASGTTASETAKPFAELYYVTHFGDGTAGVWAEGPNAGSTKNVGLGPIAAHVYETAGNFQVKTTPLYVASDGTFSCGKTSVNFVTVTDPDTIFESNTVYVSPTETPVPGADGVPMGANVLHMPNWSTLKTLVGTNGYRRIRLKRGATWNQDAYADLNNPSTMNGPGMIDAYGSGADPVIDTAIDAPAFQWASGVNDWRVVDVKSTTSDPLGTTIGNRSSFVVGGNNITLLRVETELTRIGVSAGVSTGLTVVDSILGPTSVQNTGSIGAYLDKVTDLVFMGNRGTGSYGHGVRVQGTARSVISHNYLGEVSRAGHGHALTVRGMTNDADNPTWNGLWTEKVVISSNTFKNLPGYGIDALAVKPQSNINHAERLRNIIIEKNYIESSDGWGAALLEVANDVTFRSNICVVLNAELAITVQGDNPNSPPPTSTYIYNNTLYKRQANVDSDFVGVRITDPGPTGTVMKNNVGYAPGCVNDGFGAGPATMFKTTQTNGNESTHVVTNNSSNAQLIGTKPWTATTPNAPADFAPSGTYPINSGVYVPVLTDMFNTRIDVVRDMGALEV